MFDATKSNMTKALNDIKFKTLNFLHNLLMDSIRYNVTLHKVGAALHGQGTNTLTYWPIKNLLEMKCCDYDSSSVYLFYGCGEGRRRKDHRDFSVYIEIALVR